MYRTENKFGNGVLYEAYDLSGVLHITSTACMSVWSEFLSWVNHQLRFRYSNVKFTPNPIYADRIIVLSCQVTDLAILNDLNTLDRLMKACPGKKYYIGGCLAKRFDIELPEGVRRLDNVDCNGSFIINRNIIDYAPPFWIKNFDNKQNEFSQGHLFRNMYPLRVGVGCLNNCSYCTIRVTRGQYKEIEPNIVEFQSNEDVVLIGDSITEGQVAFWANQALKCNKQISIRNLEPKEAIRAMPFLYVLAKKGLLKILHVPIQSPDKNVLNDMRRHTSSTMIYIDMAEKYLKEYTYLATNIIIDYKHYPNPDMTQLKKVFNYISWNPYWDGIWDKDRAIQRYDEYFNLRRDLNDEEDFQREYMGKFLPEESGEKRG